MLLSNFRSYKPKIFFIGIGGISMSALAKYLLINGFFVSGSDKSSSKSTDYLKELGCNIFIGHNKNNLIGHDIIVYNSAISSDNEEFAFALESRMCLIKRVELLQMIARAFQKSVGISGSHGKTTTTAMISHILLYSNLGFTSHIGGYDNCLGNLFQNGKEYFLTEVCEYDKNINIFNADFGVVLNVDNDHLNCYQNFNEIKDAFYSYLDRAEVAIINIDDKLLKCYKSNKKVVTFAINDNSAQFSAKILSSNKDGLCVRFFEKQKRLFDIKLRVCGDYNVYNALCAVSIAKTLGVSNKIINEGLNSFAGVKRRNENLGTILGCSVYADYAHHPSELKQSIQSYKKAYKDVIWVFQPHTYSRTKLLFDDFISVLGQLDNLYLYKTYPAREQQSEGYSAEFLANNLKNAKYFDDSSALLCEIKKTANFNKTIVVLGAGDIYDIFCNELKTN